MGVADMQELEQNCANAYVQHKCPCSATKQASMQSASPPPPPSLPPAQHTPLHPPCAHTHAQSSCAAASVDEVASLTLTLHSTKVLTEAKQRLCPDSACPSHTAPNSNNSKAEDSYEMQVVPQMTGAETTGNTIRACNTSVLPQPAGYCC